MSRKFYQFAVVIVAAFAALMLAACNDGGNQPGTEQFCWTTDGQQHCVDRATDAQPTAVPVQPAAQPSSLQQGLKDAVQGVQTGSDLISGKCPVTDPKCNKPQVQTDSLCPTGYSVVTAWGRKCSDANGNY